MAVSKKKIEILSAVKNGAVVFTFPEVCEFGDNRTVAGCFRDGLLLHQFDALNNSRVLLTVKGADYLKGAK